MNDFLLTDFALNSKFPPTFHRYYHKYLDDWRLLANSYAAWLQRYASCANLLRNPSIPPHIHQIWLGSKYPRKYEEWRDSWLRLNPDFTMTVWDEEAILSLPLLNRKAFIEAKNYGVKSDIARYEILYLFGGIYVDTDFECLKPFSRSFLDVTFFAGNIFSNMPQIGNGILGSKPGSLFLRKLIEGIPSTNLPSEPEAILACTGPIYLTKQWLLNQHISTGELSVIFPSDYFYPVTNFQNSNRASSDDYTANTYAEHHWEVSWMKRSLVKRLSSKLGRYL